MQLRCILDAIKKQLMWNLDATLMKIDVIQTHSYVNGYSYPTFSVRGGVEWGGVVGVVEDKAISAQLTELELD